MLQIIFQFFDSIPFFSSAAFGIIAMVIVGSSWCLVGLVMGDGRDVLSDDGRFLHHQFHLIKHLAAERKISAIQLTALIVCISGLILICTR